MADIKHVNAEVTAQEEEPPKLKVLKTRYWTFELYPDNPRHLEYIVGIRSGLYPNCTAILHDKDKTSDSHVLDEFTYQQTMLELSRSTMLRDWGILVGNTHENCYKKPHIHVVYRHPYDVFKGSIVRRFPNLESNLIQAVESVEGVYRYLVHLDDPEKHQYSPNDVFGDTATFYKYYQMTDTLGEHIAIPMILDILDNWDWSQGKPTFSKVVRICCEQGLYGYLRQGGALFTNIIKETIANYQREYEDERFLEQNYIFEKQTDIIYKLNSSLKRANETIETYKKITKSN